MSYLANVVDDMVVFPEHDFWDDGVDFFIREDRYDSDMFHLFKVESAHSAKIVYSGSEFDCQKEMAERLKKIDDYLTWYAKHCVTIKEV